MVDIYGRLGDAKLECAEEAQIELLEADGFDVIRRPAASPHAQLGLAPPREAA